jgi:hypothetical protein
MWKAVRIFPRSLLPRALDDYRSCVCPSRPIFNGFVSSGTAWFRFSGIASKVIFPLSLRGRSASACPTINVVYCPVYTLNCNTSYGFDKAQKRGIRPGALSTRNAFRCYRCICRAPLVRATVPYIRFFGDGNCHGAEAALVPLGPPDLQARRTFSERTMPRLTSVRTFRYNVVRRYSPRGMRGKS